jgi:hypothetical protein
MANKPDDLDAVRSIVATLEPFDVEEKERIIRWAREKLNIPVQVAITPTPEVTAPTAAKLHVRTDEISHEQRTGRDIKAFVDEKNPTSDMQFAATVAYYYAFEAPESNKKDSINGDDLQEACRLARRTRLKNPGQTLINAAYNGLLNKLEGGSYSINAVGENLVAMTLPAGSATAKPKKKTAKKKTAKKKTAMKKVAKKKSNKSKKR